MFIYENGMYNVEDILYRETAVWTVPRSSKTGDVVLYYHAKTAISKITALIKKVNSIPNNSVHSKPLLLEWLERAKELYKEYGGKLFAVARIVAPPEYIYDDESKVYHWRGRIYAEVGDIYPLAAPVDISEFNDFINISRQSAITPLPSNEFNRLRCIIHAKNPDLPSYFLNCKIGSLDLSQISDTNFLQKTQSFRHRFLLEAEYRSYYVDYLLRSIAGKSFWSECRCHANGKPDCFVDNVFEFQGRHYLLEVKLNINVERNLTKQLRQYVGAEYILLGSGLKTRIDSFEHTYMYVIDTNSLYCYEAENDCLIELIQLDKVVAVKQITDILSNVSRGR